MTAPYLPSQLGNSSVDTLLLTFAVGPQWWWQPPTYLCSWATVVMTLSYLPWQLDHSGGESPIYLCSWATVALTLSYLPLQLDHSGDDCPLLTFAAGPRWWWHSPIYRGSWTTVVATVSYLPLQLGHGGSNAFLLALDLCDITQHLGHLIRIEAGGAGLCLNGGCLQMIFLHITLYFFPFINIHMCGERKKEKKTHWLCHYVTVFCLLLLWLVKWSLLSPHFVGVKKKNKKKPLTMWG